MSNVTEVTETNDFTFVRVCVSTVSFSILAFFNVVINWTIVREEHLRSRARFVLVLQLLVSALVHFGTSSVFYAQIYARSRPAASVCVAMVTALITSASSILLTLTAMALDRYLAVCHSMRYRSVSGGGRCVWWSPWLVGVLTWTLALLIPLSLLTHADARGADGACGREQLKKGARHKVALISVCAGLIMFTYVRILMEGRRLGVLDKRNRVGRRTIALHGAQLAVYILPNFVNFVLTVLRERKHLEPGTKERWAVASFAFFSLAQCIAPAVYGLRKDELVQRVHRRFPLCSRRLKSALGRTVRPRPRYVLTAT